MNVPERPPFDEIVRIMYQKQLTFSDGVQRVIYSPDRTMRYVILKNDRGLVYYVYEKISVYGDDEWEYYGTRDDAFPAEWRTPPGTDSGSLFASEAELMNELMCEPEYKQYFKGGIDAV